MPVQRLSTIFLHFLKLGCVSFGGPAAHLVFFHRHFVQQLKWLNDHEYSGLVALAQLLPGPTSSQVGLAIGYHMRGYAGACLAWLGFTLPSALVMALLAILGQQYFSQLSALTWHSIQLLVLAVILWAFWQMARSFCQFLWQYLLVVVSTVLLFVISESLAQVGVIALAAVVGYCFAPPPSSSCQTASKPPLPSPRTAYIWLMAFLLPFVLFLLLPASTSITHSLFNFYQAASLVFGGGHILLPLLHPHLVTTEILSAQQFDLGYALAQLMPGPLFSFASYLGALLPLTPYIGLNALLATLAVFLPSFFLLFATLPYWSWLMHQAVIRKAVMGINAAVVSFLLYLMLHMSQDYIRTGDDVIFIILTVLLLRTQQPIWLSLIFAFMSYPVFIFVIQQL